MSHSGNDPVPLALGADEIRAQPWYAAAAAILVTAAFFAPDRYLSAGLASVGVTLVVLNLYWLARRLIGQSARSQLVDHAAQFCAHDVAPCFVADADGELCYRNPAAIDRFGEGQMQQSLARALGDLFADPATVIFRVMARVEARGFGTEDVVTRRGHVRISAHGLMNGACYWRFDEVEDRTSLRSASVGSLPLLTVGRNDTILFMNDAARQLLGGRAKTLDGICDGKWDSSSGYITVSESGSKQVLRVLELESKVGRREIYLLPFGVGASASAVDRMEFDALPVAVLQLDTSGAVLRSNRLARDLIGVTSGEMNLADCLEGPGRSVRDWLEDVATCRAARSFEVLRAARQDKDMYLQIALKRVIVDGEVGLVAVLHDATELKTLEEQFVQSQKMQAIGQLAGGIAHDFNNLLTAISGHCDLLLLRHDQEDSDYGDLMQITQNANRAAFLVGQLLAFSRKQTLQPELQDLRDTLTDLTHLLNRLIGERVTMLVAHDPDLPAIRADKRQLEQVVMNLVVNARDAMPQGGEIRIETAAHHLREDLRRDRAIVPAGDYVVLRVTDSGVGIAPDKIDKIFEPFFTTKPLGEGTGLGLSTAYGIVKQSGGFIFVDSTPGSGTCFTLYFPARSERVPEAADAAQKKQDGPREVALTGGAARVGQIGTSDTVREAAPNEQARAEGVILLVEDEAPVRAFAARALRFKGFTVLEADCAEAALRTLEDAGVKIDVFVTDVVMPGMDGPTWVRAALKKRPDTQVVFVSGYAKETLRDAQENIPNAVFLPKPFSLHELADTVQRQLA